MKALLIKKCSDHFLWYSAFVGRLVPFLKEYDDCYMSREPEGFANIVRLSDASIVDIEGENQVEFYYKDEESQNLRCLLTTIWEKRRLGQDYQRDLDNLIYYGIGKIS